MYRKNCDVQNCIPRSKETVMRQSIDKFADIVDRVYIYILYACQCTSLRCRESLKENRYTERKSLRKAIARKVSIGVATYFSRRGALIKKRITGILTAFWNCERVRMGFVILISRISLEYEIVTVSIDLFYYIKSTLAPKTTQQKLFFCRKRTNSISFNKFKKIEM